MTSEAGTMRDVLLLMTMCAAIACGKGHDSVFVYRDVRCGFLPPPSPAPCVEVGDGGLFLLCGTSLDCPSTAPFCRTLGLFGGGDYSCNASVLVCREVDRNDCQP